MMLQIKTLETRVSFHRWILKIYAYKREEMFLKKIVKLIGKWGLFMGISAIATWLLDMPTPIVPKDKEE